MARLVIEAGPIELGLFAEQWEAVTEELEAAGHTVEVEEPNEYRSGVPDVAAHTVVVLYLLEKLAGETLDQVVADVVDALKRHLRGRLRKAPTRIVDVVDPRPGHPPLAQVEVPDDEGDEAGAVTRNDAQPTELRCSECKREPRDDENALDEWRVESDGLGELHVFCPECWRREFDVSSPFATGK